MCAHQAPLVSLVVLLCSPAIGPPMVAAARTLVFSRRTKAAEHILWSYIVSVLRGSLSPTGDLRRSIFLEAFSKK